MRNRVNVLHVSMTTHTHTTSVISEREKKIYAQRTLTYIFIIIFHFILRTHIIIRVYKVCICAFVYGFQKTEIGHVYYTSFVRGGRTFVGSYSSRHLFSDWRLSLHYVGEAKWQKKKIEKTKLQGDDITVQ